MKEKIQEIAARVKEMRELSGAGVEQIAVRLGLPPSTLAAYEDGTVDIPASVLCELAHVLGVDTALLLTGNEPKMNIFTVTRKGKGVKVERRSQYKYQGLAENFIHKKAEPFLVTVEPKPECEELHTNTHPGQEFDYVLEGSLQVVIHDNELVLGPGDSVYFDSTHAHGMRAMDGKPAKFLAIIF